MSNILIQDIEDASVVPPVDIALPTRGAFYLEGEVLSEYANPDEIRVHSISILDESSFRDPLMLVSGHAISKLIKKVCPEIMNPNHLCELDVQAILIACRLATHGPTMRIEHDCPNCSTSNQLEIDLNQHINRFDPYTPEEFEQFDLELPQVGQFVRLQPMKYEDSVDMTLNVLRASQGIERFQDAQDTEALSEDFIKAYTETFEKSLETNVDALVSSIMMVKTRSGKLVHDREVIREWIAKLPPKDIKALTGRISEINQAIRERSKIEYKCQKCGETQTIHLELDPQKLFTQAEDPETETSSSAKSKNTGKTTKKPSKTSQRLS